MYKTRSSNPKNLTFDFQESASRSNHLITIKNAAIDPITVQGIRITTNAEINSPWGTLVGLWSDWTRTADPQKNLYIYQLNKSIILQKESGLTYSITGALGPLKKVPMPPTQVEVQIGDQWHSINLDGITPPVPKQEDSLKIYHTSWGQYVRKRTINDEAWQSINSLAYAFVGFDENGNVFTIDAWGDDLELPLLAMHKRKNPNSLKTTLTFGGWTNAGKRMDTVFSAMTTDPTVRSLFVKNAVSAVKQAQADGIDIDWEYANEKDAANLVALMQELRAELQKEIGPNAILTMATPADPGKVRALTKTHWQQITAVVDEIGVMTYDYFAAWDATYDFLAPWRLDENSSHYQPGGNNLDIVTTFKCYQQEMGIGYDKLVLGFPNYARSVIVATAADRAGLYQSIVGCPPGDMGAGIYSWEAINNVLNQKPSALDELNVREWHFYDSSHPYCQKAGMCFLSGQLSDGRWVVMTFLDQKAAEQRAALFKNLGGKKTMLWSNDAEPKNADATITKAIANGMRGIHQYCAPTEKAVSEYEIKLRNSIFGSTAKAEILRKVLLPIAGNHLKWQLNHEEFGKELAQHRNLFKRFLQWFLPESIMTTLFAKPTSYRLLETLHDSRKNSDSTTPSKIIWPVVKASPIPVAYATAVSTSQASTSPSVRTASVTDMGSASNIARFGALARPIPTVIATPYSPSLPQPIPPR